MTIALPASVRFVERDWLSSNQIFLVDGDTATVVDTGYVKHAPATVAIVGHLLEQTDTRLARIVNTHLHSDHCGGNHALSEAFGARIAVPKASFDEAARWDEAALTFAATGQRCDRFAPTEAIRPGAWLTMGGLQWQALAAPGHDPKSLIFHCPEARLLISADALWENGFGVLFPELEGESGFAEQQAVLELIAGLEVDLVLPGHGPAFSDASAAIERARSLLDTLRKDPRRVQRHGLKVLVKYLMLDLEHVEINRFIEHLAAASIIRHAASHLGTTPERALHDAIAPLVEQGLLVEEGGWLRNPAHRPG